jgi:isopenicillin N synthase-like dioxygenase
LIKHVARLASFILSGHGIDSSVFMEMLSNAKQFFTTAPSEEKEQIKVKPSGEGDGDDSRGYRVVKRADAGYEVSLKNEQ